MRIINVSNCNEIEFAASTQRGRKMIDGMCLFFAQITASQNEVSQYLNTDDMTSPKHKSQATSPNLPLNDLTINEDEVNTNII